MWHDGSSTQRDIFLKSGSEKNVFKTVNSICLAHAGSYGGAPPVMSLPSRGGVTSPKKFQHIFLEPSFFGKICT